MTTLSTTQLIEAMRTVAVAAETEQGREKLNAIANRMEMLVAANADMDLQLNSIRSALNIPDAQSVQSGVIDAFSRKSSDIEELTEKSNRLRRTAKEHHEENQQLRTELAELRGQEPVAYSLRFRDLRGNLEERINTPTTFDKKERADTYGRGSRYLMQPDGSIQEMRDPTRDPVTVPLYAAPVPPVASQPINAEIYELVAQAWKLIPQGDDLATAAWHSAASVFLRDYPRNLTCQPYTVPNEAGSRELFETWCKNGNGINLARDQKFPDRYVYRRAIQKWHVWEACRAAMLQPSSNSPQWIGVDWARGCDPVSSAIKDVIAERQRQISAEGWTHEHDDRYEYCEMAVAAACYIMADDDPRADIPKLWPWEPEWWKPTNIRRDLVKAGALVIAEIERLDRVEAKDGDA